MDQGNEIVTPKQGEEGSAEAAGAARLRFQVGKTYITRDRKELMTILSLDHRDTNLPIKAQRHNGGIVWYPASGNFVPSSTPGRYSWDLIAEAPEASSPRPADQREAEPSSHSAETVTVPTVDWTRPVRTRAGMTLTVLAMVPEMRMPVVCLRANGPGLTPDVWTYRADGRFFEDGKPCCNDAENY
jgi:hypothetical protein